MATGGVGYGKNCRKAKRETRKEKATVLRKSKHSSNLSLSQKWKQPEVVRERKKRDRNKRTRTAPIRIQGPGKIPRKRGFYPTKPLSTGKHGVKGNKKKKTRDAFSWSIVATRGNFPPGGILSE